MKKNIFTGLFFAVLFPCFSRAQYTVSQFEKLTVSNGLSDNVVNSVEQDNKGFIWIATMNGLNRYDGRIIENFYARNTPGSISGNRIRLLKKFSGDQLGVLSSKGFSLLHTSTLEAERFDVPDNSPLWFNMNDVFDAAELPGGHFAFTSATGFYVTGKNGSLIKRYEHFTLRDKEEYKKRIFFGNNLFSVGNRQVLLYYQDTRTALYEYDANRFTLHEDHPPASLAAFRVPQENWTIKKQIRPQEYIFLSFITDSIYYYNYAKQQKTGQPLPHGLIRNLYWDSYIHAINDSVFAINRIKDGFSLFTLNRQTGHIRFNPVVQLPGYECRTLFTDREGRLWIGTSEGVLMQKIKPPLFPLYNTNFTVPGDTTLYYNRCVYRYQDKVFVGRYAAANGLLVFDAQHMKLIKAITFFSNNQGFNRISSIKSYHPDTLWLAAEAGIIWLNVKNYSYGLLHPINKRVGEDVRLTDPDKHGVAWISGFENSIVARYDAPARQLNLFTAGTGNPLPVARPRTIVKDKEGNTWIAGFGLCRWNEKLQRFDTVIKRFAGRYPNEINVTCMTSDTMGNLWLTTVDNYLLRYKIAERKWVHYAETEGIPSGSIGTFSPVVRNQFWFAGGSDLYNMDIGTGKIARLGINAGLPGRNITSEEKNFFYDPQSDTMYLAIRDFVTRFPANLQNAAPGPDILVKEVTINNKKHLRFPVDTIRLEYYENNITVQPGIVDFEKGSGYVYHYRLNQKTEWNLLGESPLIFFDRLSPGTHTITIRVSGHSALVKEKTIVLVIRPPFWRTAWFYALCALALATLLYFVYKVRIRAVQKKALLNQHVAEFEMKALHAQMNPHFIFNCLNSIKGLIINNQNREASEYLSKFSSLVRLNLEHSRMPVITLKENIEYLRQYIAIEQLRYGNLSSEIIVDEHLDTEEITIAPMLLQPLVENAIWHGLQSVRYEKKLKLQFILEGKKVICRVDDNGIGIIRSLQQNSNRPAPSVGLRNIHERIRLLNEKFGLNYQLTIRDKSEDQPEENGTVTTLSFTIPET